MQVPAKFLNLLFKYIWHVLMTEQGGFMSLGVEIINYTYIWSLNKFKLKIYPQDCFQNHILHIWKFIPFFMIVLNLSRNNKHNCIVFLKEMQVI